MMLCNMIDLQRQFKDLATSIIVMYLTTDVADYQRDVVKCWPDITAPYAVKEQFSLRQFILFLGHLLPFANVE
jgi:hypothetical protein